MARDVLIIEDEEPVAGALETSFRQAGYSVFTAATVAAAEKILGAHSQPQDLLLVVDVALKNESGVDFAVSAARRFPSIRVLFISGYIDELLHMDSTIPRGHVGFLGKPFTSAELLSAARHILA